MTSSRTLWQRITLLCIALALPSVGFSAPFSVDKRNNLWNSSTLFWDSLLTTPPSQELPLATTISGFSSELTLSVSANNGNIPLIVQRDEATVPGVYATCGTQSSFQINLSKGIQGFGAVMEPETPAKTRFIIEFFSPSYQLVHRTTVNSDGEPVYVGGIDPDSELFLILIYAVDQATFLRVPFYIGDLEFQLKPEQPPLPELPISSTTTVDIAPLDTYLHRGLTARNLIPETDTAAADHDNAYDLLELFPALRVGDYLLLERQGVSLYNGKSNPLLAVFMSNQTLLASKEFNRVPSAIKAGRSYYTSFTSVADSQFNTPTNIPQDFAVNSQTFISVPAGARYIFFSKAIPTADGGPLSVKISRIERYAFYDWLAELGLFGDNALPESDLDKDGLTLIEEFAFGKDPTTQDTRASDFAFAPNGFLSSGNLRIAFGARTDAPLYYHAEFSDDMIEWDRVENVGRLITDESGQSRAIFAADDPNPGPRRFGRVIIEQVLPDSQ